MMPLNDAPAGYASVVHQGPLEPVTILWAPHTFVLYNVMIAMLMLVWVTWRWLWIALGVHLVAALLTTIDPNLLAMLWQQLWYRRFYGAS